MSSEGVNLYDQNARRLQDAAIYDATKLGHALRPWFAGFSAPVPIGEYQDADYYTTVCRHCGAGATLTLNLVDRLSGSAFDEGGCEANTGFEDRTLRQLFDGSDECSGVLRLNKDRHDAYLRECA